MHWAIIPCRPPPTVVHTTLQRDILFLLSFLFLGYCLKESNVSLRSPRIMLMLK